MDKYIEEGRKGEGRRGGRKLPSDSSSNEEGAVDINVKDPPPGLDVILDREFRLRDAGEAEQDRDAVKGVCDFRHSVVDGPFVRDVDLLKHGPQRLAVPHALKVPQGFRAHTLVDVEDGQLRNAVLEKRSGADEAEALRAAGHWGRVSAGFGVGG